ncbi:CST complex subunit TEN1 [Latimeria chalumnae]|nr:PREDICTED: CST complex subunit TEN1 [Latimeria chalumnae]XP_014342278.1 PREDICTED: CST complex subunit TEN1 [Latimeria chalumnae]|eukprot:XP_005993283.1 PREDICTED: CST complex subunit TEN1 [Latimeria chalumnae]
MNLPEAGQYKFLWEISLGEIQEGKSVRTFGRLISYDAEQSEVILATQHDSSQYQVIVSTTFVEPFQPHFGTPYITLGEIQKKEGDQVQIKARILTCVDGINVSLLEHAIKEQRRYFQEREGR